MEFCSGDNTFSKNQYNIKQTIKDFDEIDFSLILRRSFHVTLDQNKQLIKKGNFNLFNTTTKVKKLTNQKKKYKVPKNNMSPPLKILQSFNRLDGNQNKSTEDLSLIAGKIVTNALHIPRSLFCPFCADEYMFEFTLKDHLKRKHTNELTKRNENDLPESDQTLDENNHLCPYCHAVFYIFGLVPKHVANHHGRNWLQHWQQTFGQKLRKNFSESSERKDPSIIYAACSPGLSDIFDKLITKDSDSLLSTSAITDSPQLKSILKKTPNKSQSVTQNRIINSPSGISIRRNKSEIIKRSISVRRELRFDLPPLKITPNNSPIIRKHRKLQDLVRLFRFRRNKNVSSASLNPSKSFELKKKRQKLMLSQQNIVTSTPINFLDEIDDTGNNYNVKWNLKKVFSKKISKKMEILKNRPLLFSSERYQCACCNERYQSNPDLLMHLKEKHRSAKYLLRPHYKCGQCGVKFFRNSYLVRHCHFQHTPQKNYGNRNN